MPGRSDNSWRPARKIFCTSQRTNESHTHASHWCLPKRATYMYICYSFIESKNCQRCIQMSTREHHNSTFVKRLLINFKMHLCPMYILIAAITARNGPNKWKSLSSGLSFQANTPTRTGKYLCIFICDARTLRNNSVSSRVPLWLSGVKAFSEVYADNVLSTILSQNTRNEFRSVTTECHTRLNKYYKYFIGARVFESEWYIFSSLFHRLILFSQRINYRKNTCIYCISCMYFPLYYYVKEKKKKRFWEE